MDLQKIKIYLFNLSQINQEKVLASLNSDFKKDSVFILEENQNIEDTIYHVYICSSAKLHLFEKLNNSFVITVEDDRFFLNDLRNLKKYITLSELSLTDEVTGGFNQRKLLIDLETQIKISEEKEQHFSLLFVDIDHFKIVNDQYGHIVGSDILKQLTEELKILVRSTDTVYRYGGDEFIILMRDTKTQVVHTVAKRILNKIKDVEFKILNDEIYHLSISIGIAEFPIDAKSSKEIVEFADKMMYKSKKSGRGKVFHVKEV